MQLEEDIKFLYFYDNDQRLDRQELWAEDMQLASNEYRYLNGKLYFRTHSIYSGEKALVETSVTKYTYTGEQLTTVVENVLERHGEESAIITNFTYTDEGFIKSAVQKWVTAEGYRIVVESTFTIGINGNILQIKEITFTNGVAAKPDIYTMEYDDKRNPRYHLIDPVQFTEYFSPNNVVSLKEDTSAKKKTTEFRYQYNPQRMPTSVEANDVVQTEFRNVAKWIYY
ncbi:MAG: hypothetical protein EOP48_23080 [Sphingobacteriales bacterium]|nr:MAG: hypothetical protein EOP48_23080 [Sphingobacteriales bacterium]